jgi:uncharacterized SAM-binding protein YcdF (DUF218 family)
MSILRRLRKSALAATSVLGAVWIVVAAAPVFTPWIGALSGTWNEPEGDTLIVLGNDAGPRTIIGMESYWRCVYALMAWRRGGFSRLVVSGASPLAETMRDFLTAGGVDPQAIRLESDSRSTRENAVFTSRLLGGHAGRKVLLTSDYHMFRALRSFRKAGLDVLPCPIPDAGKRANAWQYRQAVLSDLVVETIKIAWYRWKGWI